MAQQQKLGYAWWNLQVVHVLLMLENNILLSHKETYKVTQQGFPFFFQKGCTMTQSMLVSTWSRAHGAGDLGGGGGGEVVLSKNTLAFPHWLGPHSLS